MSMVTVGMKHVKFWKLEGAGGGKLIKYGGKTDTNIASADFIEKLNEDPETGGEQVVV